MCRPAIAADSSASPAIARVLVTCNATAPCHSDLRDARVVSIRIRIVLSLPVRR